ncbi:MAG TPA: CDP-archaeol synthase [Pseudoclavibacter sp.]|nr:CDP-archaeol synthase [Pseudoclavibacter sp.]
MLQHWESARQQFEEANERIEKRAGRNLFLAVGTGIVIGGLLLVSLIFVKWAFLALALAGGVGAAVELAAAIRRGGVLVPRVAVGIGTGAVLLCTAAWDWPGMLWGTPSAIVVVFVWYLLEVSFRVKRGEIPQRTPRQLIRDALSIAGTILYTGTLVSFAVLLLAEDGGQWWVLGFIIVVVVNDTCAYAVGVLWGRHKMFPVISPKKTWEGFLGGIAGAVLAGVLVSTLMLSMSIPFGFLWGFVLALSGTAGDVLESRIKRRIGIKDMSSWLPGHGGVLDRLDSIILSAAVAYALSLVAF